MKETVSLNEFGKKYNVKKEAKGELFFQLLHMDFKLTQNSPQTFEDILICQHWFDYILIILWLTSKYLNHLKHFKVWFDSFFHRII